MTAPSAAPRKVAVLYTGGTIGMVEGPYGYEPQSGHLARRLEVMPQFHDPSQPQLTMPLSRFGRRIRYEIAEVPPILDSSDLAPADWRRIAEAVEAHYDRADAFVILHGTDTLAYTASALSFMLAGLAKTVVLTGSQVPLSEVYNDAVNNLLGALTIAGHFEIPEVTVFFGQKLLRGNRTQKVDATGFGAFDSANLAPLATVGTSIDVAWDLIRAVDGGPFSVVGTPSDNVACLRLFPGIRAELLDNVLRPPTSGLVLETYGSGNGPSNRADLFDVLRDACARGVVVVNCTQCHRGAVQPLYAGALALSRAGVISGGDMTPEAALTKLAWLIGQGLSAEEVRRRMAHDERGELTPPRGHVRFSFRERTFVQSVARMLGQYRDLEDASLVERALYPVLLCAAARMGDVASLARLLDEGVDPNWPDYDGRTALHVAATAGQREVAALLVARGASPTSVDSWGHTPSDEAARAGHDALAAALRPDGAAPAQDGQHARPR